MILTLSLVAGMAFILSKGSRTTPAFDKTFAGKNSTEEFRGELIYTWGIPLISDSVGSSSLAQSSVHDSYDFPSNFTSSVHSSATLEMVLGKQSNFSQFANLALVNSFPAFGSIFFVDSS